MFLVGLCSFWTSLPTTFALAVIARRASSFRDSLVDHPFDALPASMATSSALSEEASVETVVVWIILSSYVKFFLFVVVLKIAPAGQAG